MPARFNHACSFGFQLYSHMESGDDITGAQLRAAITERMLRLTNDELIEACCPPYDTVEEPENGEDE